MARTVAITLPSNRTNSLLADIEKGIDGIISIKAEKGISLKPKGDVLTVEVTNKRLPELMKLLARKGIGSGEDSSISSSQPLSVISKSSDSQIISDTNESSWEEIEQTLVRENPATLNALAVMFVAGAIAAIGIATNALHIVIGAMIIAPAFQPILRVPLGIITQSHPWKAGLIVFIKSYAALVAGAFTAALLISLFQRYTPYGSAATYLEGYELVRYWSSITVPSVLSSALAAVAGTLLVMTNRSVLTAGVLVALALVPSFVLVGVGLANLRPELIGVSALRGFIDVSLVTVIALVIMKWKRSKVYRRQRLP